MSPLPMAHHVFVGAETGLLKGLNVTDNKWDNLNELSSVNRSNEICVMCWENQRKEDTILLGTRGGTVKSYNQHTRIMQDILQVTDSDDQVMKGLYKLDSKYVTCTNTGSLCIWRDEQQSTGEENELQPVLINCGADITCMREDPCSPTNVATGGKENCLKIFDLNKPEAGPVFKAKNVRDDWLDLRVPLWVTDIGYMPKASASLLVTSTGYHQIRVYDPSTVQRRPVIEMEWEELPITSICVSPYNERQVMVGNTAGEQALLDVRNKKCLGKYKGGAGAIRSIQCHPTLPVVVSCGLDRYVRVYDINSRILTQKVYMKSRLNKLLLTSNWEEDKVDEDIQIVKEELSPLSEQEPNESDELWENIETVGGDNEKIADIKKQSKHISTEPAAEETTSSLKSKRKRKV